MPIETTPEKTPPALEATGSFDRSLVEGPLFGALWKIAWPTLLQNLIAGLQGVVDHIMVGRFVGYTGNAAIGISWQIFLVVVVFVGSIFTGMGVLVARSAGASQPERVNRVVYQGFITAVMIHLVLLAPLGFFLAPDLLDFVNAAPEVKAEALPYLTTMFVFSIGMLFFFLLGGALRAAGDAKTPLRLGVVMTLLNLVLNLVLIRGLGPIPAFGTTGAAMGTVISSALVSGWALWLLFKGKLVVKFTRGMGLKPNFATIRSIFRFGLPTGFQGIAMNLGGVLLLRFIGSLEASAEAHAIYTVGYTQLFAFITFSSVALMAASSTIAGQSLGAQLPDRASLTPRSAAMLGLGAAIPMGLLFLVFPGALLGLFDLREPGVVMLGRELLAYLSVSGLFLTTALAYTGALQGTGDTRSPMYITMVSQLALPLAICAYFEATGNLQPHHIWSAIVAGHLTRCTLSIARFRQGKWRQIEVETGAA